jgi:hypothetical protein
MHVKGVVRVVICVVLCMHRGCNAPPLSVVARDGHHSHALCEERGVRQKECPQWLQHLMEGGKGVRSAGAKRSK